uniref:Angiopoietin-like 6 n=1 Tax=Gasterosteus aculeatus aculeatus TaxID=481459 RepID=G3P5Y1_GASAC|nr:hemicentin-1-like [Gasterosteus aculeatus aculeatus]
MLTATMLPLKMLGLLMLFFSMCDADGECLPELILNPPEVLGEYGDTVTVNCSSADSDNFEMYGMVGNTQWQPEYENSVTWNVTLSDWNVTAECVKQLNNTSCRKELKIRIYQNPEEVVVGPTKNASALEGTQYQLQCDVLNVAPVQHLTVSWYRDGETIRTDNFTHLNATKGLASESSTLTATFSRAENGAQFHCGAHLDFGEHGSKPAVNSSVHAVSVHYAAELKNQTEYVDGNEGDHVTLKCEAEGRPAPVFSWSLDGKNLMETTSDLNITLATNAIYICTASNYLGNTTKLFNVYVMKTNVMGAPSAITTPEPSTPKDCPLVLTPAKIVVRFGDPAEVECSTSAKGLQRMGWEAPSGATASETNVTIWTVDQVKDWATDPLCYLNTKDKQCSVKLKITLYKTADSVSVSALDQGPMVEGTEYLLKCDITNVAPVQKLKVTWYRGNETVETQMFNDTSEIPVNVSSTFRITPERDSDGELFRCDAKLHLGPNGPKHVPTKSSSPFKAVVHYKPLVKTCPGSYAGVEQEFSIDKLSCDFAGNPPPTVKWYYKEKLINASQPLTRDQSGEYTAQIENHLGSINTSVLVSIEYGPSFTCDDRYEVRENEIVHCEADGKPKPNVSWFVGEKVEGGKEVAAVTRWTKNDRGIYSLQAINKHGSATHRLRVDVLYAPVFTESYSEEVNVFLGDNVTFGCSADGHPPPDIQWRKSSEAHVTVTTRGSQKSITVAGATSTDAGVYICDATNNVTVVTRTVTLVVKDRKPVVGKAIWWLIILLVFVIVFIAIGVAQHYKTHGQYSFVSAKPDNDGSGIPMTTQPNGVSV